jgi:type IV pilus biogenesis protein CpaD/CtpE
MRYTRIHSLLAATVTSGLLLTACAGPTPYHELEPLQKQDIIADYTEDRITLNFGSRQTQLTDEQRSYISRFVNYYYGAEDSIFFLSLLIEPENEDPRRVPSFKPWDRDLLANMASYIQSLGVKPRHIKEVDIGQDPALLEARAWKAVMDSARNDTGPEASALANAKKIDPQDLQSRRKVALVVRVYDIRPANCPEPGAYSMPGARPSSSGILLGCATMSNLIAQTKDKTVFVEPKPIDPTYSSSMGIESLKALRENAGNAAATATGSTEDASSTEGGGGGGGGGS